jgi:Flp pilus assembly protein TadG
MTLPRSRDGIRRCRHRTDAGPGPPEVRVRIATCWAGKAANCAIFLPFMKLIENTTQTLGWRRVGTTAAPQSKRDRRLQGAGGLDMSFGPVEFLPQSAGWRAGRLVRSLRRFRREDGGSASVFVISFVLVLILVSGYAIDVMRFEGQRTRLQGTLDRAVLAAASLTQPRDCGEVVQDYFNKAGLGENLDSYDCTVLARERSVAATASLNVDTMFMEGVDTLVAPASGAAREADNDVEVAMVIDTSFNMGASRSPLPGTVIENIRPAAQRFVDMMVARDEKMAAIYSRPTRVSITILPFSSNVHFPQWMIDAMPAVTYKTGFSDWRCLDLPNSVWNTQGAINVNNPLLEIQQQPRMIEYHPNQLTSWTSYVIPTAQPFTESVIDQSLSLTSCNKTTSSIEMIPPGQTRAFMVNRLKTLEQDIGHFSNQPGTPSIDKAVKWGVTLLDPVMRDVYATGISQGHIAATMAGRPYDYGREATIKALIVLSGGPSNSPVYEVAQAYQRGMSPIWRGSSDGQYAIHHPGITFNNNKYYTPKNNAWNSDPSWSGSGPTRQLPWTEVWERLSVDWVSSQLYGRPLGQGNSSSASQIGVNQRSAMKAIETDGVTRRQRAIDACTQAKQNGVIIYYISFTAAASDPLSSTCPTSPSTFYQASRTGNTGDIFDSIANSISALRMTQ